jgi:acyl-CoA synthetase (AMP-forming)/AMP-acid ligase II
MNPTSPTTHIHHATWIDVVRWRTERHPDRHVYTFLVDGETKEATLTYAELEQRARAIGGWLQAQGLQGQRVLLVYPPGLEYNVAFFGCLYAGVVAVPTYPPRLNRPDIRLEAIVADSQAAAALSTTPILSTLDQRIIHAPTMRSLRWMASDTADAGYAATWRDPGCRGESLAFLQYTSGSTAQPRGAMVTHANALQNAAVIGDAVAATEESRGLLWLPPYHDMGLMGGILQPVYSGVTTTLMSPFAFLQRPFRWLQAIARTGATHSGAPNFAFDLCVSKITPQQRATLDLSSWRVAFSGAEPIRHETLDRFTEAFAPSGFRRESFLAAYGLAEATLLVACSRLGRAPERHSLDASALEQHRVLPANGAAARVVVGCGRPLPGGHVVIVDPDTGVACGPNRVGEIWVSGPSVTRGYWNRPEESALVFGARLADTGEGPFLRTGDLGFMRDGNLAITGRIKDLIILDGRNHYPQDIEGTIEQRVPAIRLGGVAAFSVDRDGAERLVIAAEVARSHRGMDQHEIVRAVRRAVAEEHAVSVHTVVLLRAGGVPKTSSGKTQRRACRAAFLAGTLDATAGES